MKKDELYNLPKIDLHVHLDGSMRPSTVVELATKQSSHSQFPVPISSLPEALIVPKSSTLSRYLELFNITLATLQSAHALERAAFELCEDAAEENIIYMEIRFAPFLHLERGLTPSQVVRAVLSGMNRASSAYPITTRLILCAMKQQPPQNTIRVSHLASEFSDQGVVGIDLAGPERDYALVAHEVTIKTARDSGLYVTIHAGEECCPQQIRHALELGANRIGHGVYLFQDNQLKQQVIDQQTPLELCPTSNCQTAGFISGYEEHPIKDYFDQGIKVTVNTDNRLMSNTTITNELCQLAKAFSLTDIEIRQLLLNSAASAFAPQALHDDLCQQIAEAMPA